MRGTIRYLNRDNQGALTDLENAVNLEPDEAVPWNSLGAVHLALGRHDLALFDFSRAIELKKDYAEAYLNRALTLSGMNRLREALADFDASIQLQPGKANAYLWRSQAKNLLGDKAGALRDALNAQALGHPVESGYIEGLRKATAGP
jgi:tetratricopeptide (TPR) repeat protein